VANSIEFLRTGNSLRQSAVGESYTGNSAEAVIYNPSTWMMQPATSGGGADYDAITSLPPVL
jgi:hypothetical protein